MLAPAVEDLVEFRSTWDISLAESATLSLTMEFDLFLSHASEDKRSLVRPLALRLRESGYAIWYDEFVLKIEDSLTEPIDYGLANSVVGIIVLSEAFFVSRGQRESCQDLLLDKSGNRPGSCQYGMKSGIRMYFSSHLHLQT